MNDMAVAEHQLDRVLSFFPRAGQGGRTFRGQYGDPDDRGDKRASRRLEALVCRYSRRAHARRARDVQYHHL